MPDRREALSNISSALQNAAAALQVTTLSFHHVLEKAQAAFPRAGDNSDGVALSRALRVAGLNRDHDAVDQKTVTYKRTAVG